MTPKHFHAYPQEKFGDNKGVTRSSKLKKIRQYKKKPKRQTVLNKTPDRKLKIEQLGIVYDTNRKKHQRYTTNRDN